MNTVLKEMDRFSASSWGMNGQISIQNGCHIGLVIQYGYLLHLFPIQDEQYFLLYSLEKLMAHPEYSTGPPFKQALQSKVEMGFHIKWAFK